MSDNERSAFGQDDPNRGPLDRTANTLDGRDDPNRGPLDRADNVLHGQDDPNRGPLDRAANAITGGTGGVSGAMAHDDPNRGPLDRADNALHGHDDPNRGPLDRAANAITGGTGGVSGAMAHDDPNRGPLDRTANMATGGTGGVAGATDATMATGTGGGVASAVFDSDSEAQAAVADLRAAGVTDGAISLLTQNRNTMTTRSTEGEVVDEEHGSLLRGILGGGALGAGLGVVALAIPGVGPLVGLGAIAASAVPQAMAVGATLGAAAGTWNEMLAKHGIGEADAAYYGDQMKTGGILVTVDSAGLNADGVRDILYRNGGHNAARARVATM